MGGGPLEGPLLHSFVNLVFWGLGIGVAVLSYELLRASLLRRVRIRLERQVSQYLARHRVRLDRFKFTHKHYIREALLADPHVHAFLAVRSEAEGVPVTELSVRAEEYIEEIVPYFNLVSYYKLGYGLAGPLLRLLYAVEFSPSNLAATERALQSDAATVYVMNHRSNADYVLFAVCMSRQVALSYAVGEWARVWPLEGLFKSFGSYFVRRGEKDPLYHKVLERYIQLVTRGGLTQGIFLEGGLSRDGRFRSPKVGLLDSLLGVTDDGADVQFVPVGLNFDRVLEDTRLLAEDPKGADAPGPAEKVRSLSRLLWTLPRAVVARALAAVRAARVVRGHGFGVASVHAGAPISLRAELGPELEVLRNLPRSERRPRLQRLADQLMTRIGRQVPVTPVPLVCHALLRELSDQEGTLALDRLQVAIGRELSALRRGGAPIALGPALRGLGGERAALDDEASAARRPLLDLTRDLLDGEEAQRIWEVVEPMLVQRGVLGIEGTLVRLPASGLGLVRYYAASLEGHAAPE